MFRKLMCAGIVFVVVCSTVTESEAARRHRRGRSGRSSDAARMQRYVRARQQQMQKAYLNYQRLMLQRQQQLAQQRAADLARRRQAAQARRQQEEESRRKRKEYLLKQRQEHDEKDRAAGIKHGSPEEMLKNYDKNGDGALTKDEVRGSPLSLRFTETDANKDRKLTIQELRAAKAAATSNQPQKP